MAESNEEKLSRVREMASGSETWDLSSNDIAALKYVLSLLRPVASMEGVVRELDLVDDTARICSNDESFEGWVNLPGATVGQRVRIDVHAVDAGEEK